MNFLSTLTTPRRIVLVDNVTSKAEIHFGSFKLPVFLPCTLQVSGFFLVLFYCDMTCWDTQLHRDVIWPATTTVYIFKMYPQSFGVCALISTINLINVSSALCIYISLCMVRTLKACFSFGTDNHDSACLVIHPAYGKHGFPDWCHCIFPIPHTWPQHSIACFTRDSLQLRSLRILLFVPGSFHLVCLPGLSTSSWWQDSLPFKS